MSEQNTLEDFAESEDDEQGWGAVQLGNEAYFTRYSGDTPSRSNDEYWGGDIHWLSNSEVRDGTVNFVNDTEDRITKSGLENCTAQLVPDGSVILSCTASIGKVAINNRKMATNQQFNSLNIKRGFNSFYLANQLLSMKEELETLGGSTTHNHLSVYLLDKVEVEKPPLSEQRKIATVLYNVDRAIQKTEEIIKQSERVRDGITQDVFTTGYYNHKEHSDIRLGPIRTSAPADWDIKSIPDYFDIIDGDRGKNYPSGSDFSDEGYCLFLNASNVTEEGLKFDETEFITEEKDGELRKGKLDRGDIIMTTRGTVGNFGIYDGNVDYENVRINSGMVILRPKENAHLVDFYYHFFRSGIFQRQINATSYGTAQPQTSVTDIKKMDILEPSHDEKEEIAELLGDMVSKIQVHKEYRNQLVAVKQGLMKDLLSGTVRTTDTNIEVPEEIEQYG